MGQALGRFGNWFNQELYGLPTTLPWGLEIDPMYRVDGYGAYSTFHPTFLYESVWDVAVAGVLLWADRRFTLGRGKVFALYLALYGFGRIFTESLRTDYSYPFFGALRFNAAVAALVCLGGVVALAWLIARRPGREEIVDPAVSTLETGRESPTQTGNAVTSDIDKESVEEQSPDRPDAHSPPDPTP